MLLQAQGTFPNAGVTYWLLAGVTHSTMTAVVQLLQVIEDPTGRHPLRAGHTGEIAGAGLAAQIAVFGYGNAFDRQLEGHGWDPALWSAWRVSRIIKHRGDLDSGSSR